jgi:hypothetical protein
MSEPRCGRELSGQLILLDLDQAAEVFAWGTYQSGALYQT